MGLHAFIGLLCRCMSSLTFFSLFIHFFILYYINVKGLYYRNAAFCYLTHNYNNRISKDLLVYWFKGICSKFER